MTCNHGMKRKHYICLINKTKSWDKLRGVCNYKRGWMIMYNMSVSFPRRAIKETALEKKKGGGGGGNAYFILLNNSIANFAAWNTSKGFSNMSFNSYVWVKSYLLLLPQYNYDIKFTKWMVKVQASHLMALAKVQWNPMAFTFYRSCMYRECSVWETVAILKAKHCNNPSQY